MIKAVRAKKYLGQHFLINKLIAESISELISENEEKEILEIGPGMGILTEYLLQKKIRLKVVEIDLESVNYLKKKYPKLKKKIIYDDFLKLNLNQIFTKKISIVGNFPYNISSQILFKVYENKDKINELVGMFQKEVADRVVCENGRKKGILSILIQTFYEVQYCFSVDEKEFSPPPKVKSAVIKITRNSREKLDCNPKLFKTIVKSAYNQRRKTIKNALKNFNFKEEKNLVSLMKLRAENLSVEDFIVITKNVKIAWDESTFSRFNAPLSSWWT